MSFQLKIANKDDYSFLREMLLQAIFVEPEAQSPDRAILDKPDISKYVESWGKAGDIGLIAQSDGKNIGAAWIRVFSNENRGFGWVDENTPELSMAVDHNFRSQGVGTLLLESLLEKAQMVHNQISLSVSPNNPVLRLYERLGFKQVGIHGTSVTMLKVFR